MRTRIPRLVSLSATRRPVFPVPPRTSVSLSLCMCFIPPLPGCATAPWALALPPMNRCLMLHVVTSGECWLEVEGSPDYLLQPGALALVPHGEGHRMASQPAWPEQNFFQLPGSR